MFNKAFIFYQIQWWMCNLDDELDSIVNMSAFNTVRDPLAEFIPIEMERQTHSLFSILFHHTRPASRRRPHWSHCIAGWKVRDKSGSWDSENPFVLFRKEEVEQRGVKILNVKLTHFNSCMSLLSCMIWIRARTEALVSKLFFRFKIFSDLLAVTAAHKSPTHASVSWVISTLWQRTDKSRAELKTRSRKQGKHTARRGLLCNSSVFFKSFVDSLQFLQQTAWMWDGIPNVFDPFVSYVIQTYRQGLQSTSPTFQQWAQLLEDQEG